MYALLQMFILPLEPPRGLTNIVISSVYNGKRC